VTVPDARPREVVLTERRGGVLLITINRPEVRNALNLAVLGDLSRALEDLDADPSVAAAILTGAPPCFSAGMDLRAFVAGEEMWEGGDTGRGMKSIVSGPCAKPLIAAVEGFAVAGGFELALACDIIVAGRSARFGIPEVKRSIVAGGGALRQLPRRVGPGVAMKLALTGESVEGAEAGELGLVGAGGVAGRARGGPRRPPRRPGDRAGARAGRRDRAQRTARGRREQADPPPSGGLVRRGVLDPPVGDRRPGDALRRCP
jgi:enoyl-CoA hydratase